MQGMMNALELNRLIGKIAYVNLYIKLLKLFRISDLVLVWFEHSAKGPRSGQGTEMIIQHDK